MKIVSVVMGVAGGVMFAQALTSARADALEMTRDARGALVLTSKSCEQLLAQEKALCAWKKKTEPEFVILAPVASGETQRCLKVAGGKVRLSIFECLPRLAKDHFKKKLARSGPNCWGTAMSFQGLFPKPRFMWPEEMMYWMDSPFCRKLAVGEALQPGDVIHVFFPEYLDADEAQSEDAGTRFWQALYPGRYTPLFSHEGGYTGYHGLLHSVTYVTHELAFGKDSPARDDPFYFHALEEVYGRPRADNQGCQENQSFEPYLREYQKPPKEIIHSKCDYFSLAYRCEDIQSSLSAQVLSSQDQEIWKNIQSMNAIQEKLFSWVTGDEVVLNPAEVNGWVGLADVTEKMAWDELKTLGQDKTREMLLVMEYFAAAGIRESLRLGKYL